MRSLPLILFLHLLTPIIAVGEMEMIYEVFSIPINKAAQIQREKLTGQESHQRLVKLTELGSAKLEVWMTAKARLGETITLEEVEEIIYPTEFEPPELPNMVGTGFSQAIPSTPIPVPTTATSYDTKKTGHTLELKLKKENRSLRITLWYYTASLIQLDTFGKGVGKAEMPRFSVQRIGTTAIIAPEKPALMGTISPPKDLQKEKEKRVWLAYITVSKSKD